MDVNDKQLIDNLNLFAELAQGSEKAFVKIYWNYTKRLYPFVLKMTHDEVTAEEIIQEVFVQLWEKRAQLKNVQYPTSYLFQIASNKTLNYLKRESNRSRILENYAKSHSEVTYGTDKGLDLKETSEILRLAIDSLPEQRKLIFELSRQEGLSNEEIAQQLGIAKQTVKNQLVTALKNIRTYMEHRQSFFSFALFYLLTKK
ncbi:RNA polymerase sigma factor [Mucilaginibacter ximonensis]|uniref:RNA polymerase sigma factor n=1 Tax=Mucilaginibacter ximonensis TaxID=538021 RepID=A0ABW5YBF6_9SPHI